MADTIRDKIRAELDRRGWSGYRLGKESGVPIRTIQKYVAGQMDMTGGGLEKLFRVLGLEVRPKRRKGR